MMNAIDERKYQQAILFFIAECNNHHLGKTKLMKLLYYLDFDHYQQHGTPVTGDTYICLQYGPVPQLAEQFIIMTENAGLLHRKVGRPGAPDQVRYTITAQGQAALDQPVFSDTERDVLMAIRHRWCDASRKDIVEATHTEAPWRDADHIGQVIPYEWAHRREPADSGGSGGVPTFTDAQREWVLDSVLASQALEDVHVPRAVAARLLDEVMREPLPKIG